MIPAIPEALTDAKAAFAAAALIPAEAEGAPAAAGGGLLIDAAAVFVRKRRAFVFGLGDAYWSDVANLPLPQLFCRWLAIGDGLGLRHMIEQLHAMRLALRNGLLFPAVTTGAPGDDLWNWKCDPALVELNRQLAEITTLFRRAAAVLDAELEERRRQDERERSDAQARHLAEHPRRQGW